MNFFKRRKILKQANFLDLIPIRNMQYEVSENGNINILIPKFKNISLRKIIIPNNKSHFIKVKLDELGSQTWLAIDDKRTVEQIYSYLAEKYGEKISPVEERVNKFITILYQQQYITFKQLLQI
ncbi:MAG: hypothetical protein A2X12_10635 [Bacteroidetes bacterium GWE2_29_8]|nr:MAG: hypothetical protein A2X12_10635 [Bacteroidetes bacterium GWE2_29_8]OFY24850.1 MAG: hypothetical protein A2X02_03895 [Bacteroidetes bacterium GWF2_29_10]